MDIQYVIVLMIVLAAAVYVGGTFRRHGRSFSKKPGCDADCGCASNTKGVKIGR